VLHPLLGEFLIERLRESESTAAREIVDPLIEALMESRRWDECLTVAEAVPEACTFASQLLESSLDELLGSGRVATVRRWVSLARGLKLTDPIVDLADAEVALRAGDYDHALATGSQAALCLASRDLRSRAELVAARGAQLADHRQSPGVGSSELKCPQSRRRFALGRCGDRSSWITRKKRGGSKKPCIDSQR
jgi:ATP/maltotriose-dependent transcriptional regulator MalT